MSVGLGSILKTRFHSEKLPSEIIELSGFSLAKWGEKGEAVATTLGELTVSLMGLDGLGKLPADIYHEISETKGDLFKEVLGFLPKPGTVPVDSVIMLVPFLLVKGEVLTYLMKKKKLAFRRKLEQLFDREKEFFNLSSMGVSDFWNRLIKDYYAYKTGYKLNEKTNIFSYFRDSELDHQVKVKFLRDIVVSVRDNVIAIQALGQLMATLMSFHEYYLDAEDKDDRVLVELLRLGNSLPPVASVDQLRMALTVVGLLIDVLFRPSEKNAKLVEYVLSSKEDAFEMLYNYGTTAAIVRYAHTPPLKPFTWSNSEFWNALTVAVGVADEKSDFSFKTYQRLFKRMVKVLYRSGLIPAMFEYWMEAGDEKRLPAIISIHSAGLGASSNWSMTRIAQYIEGRLAQKMSKIMSKSVKLEFAGRSFTVNSITEINRTFQTPLKAFTGKQFSQLAALIRDVYGLFIPPEDYIWNDQEGLLRNLIEISPYWTEEVVKGLGLMGGKTPRQVLVDILDNSVSYEDFIKETLGKTLETLKELSPLERYQTFLRALVAPRKRMDISFDFEVEVRRRGTRTVQALAWILTIASEFGADKGLLFLKTLPLAFLVTPSVSRRIMKSAELVGVASVFVSGMEVKVYDFASHRKVAQFLLKNFFDETHAYLIQDVKGELFTKVCYVDYLNKARKFLDVVEQVLD